MVYYQPSIVAWFNIFLNNNSDILLSSIHRRVVGTAVGNKAFSNWISCHYSACILSVVHEALDLMTTSCPSRTNQLRQTRCLLLQLFDPEPRRIDFPLNGMRWDARKRGEQERGGEAGKSEGVDVNLVKRGVRGRRSPSAVWGEWWHKSMTVHVWRPAEHGSGQCVRREGGREKGGWGVKDGEKELGNRWGGAQGVVSRGVWRGWADGWWKKIQHSSKNSVVWTGSLQGEDVTLHGYNFQLGCDGHVTLTF